MSAQFRFITKRELAAMLGVSRATLERSVAEGRIPRPYKLGRRSVRWRSDEVAECISNMPRIEDAYACHVTGSGKRGAA